MPLVIEKETTTQDIDCTISLHHVIVEKPTKGYRRRFSACPIRLHRRRGPMIGTIEWPRRGGIPWKFGIETGAGQSPRTSTTLHFAYCRVVCLNVIFGRTGLKVSWAKIGWHCGAEWDKLFVEDSKIGINLYCRWFIRLLGQNIYCCIVSFSPKFENAFLVFVEDQAELIYILRVRQLYSK